MSGDNPPRTSGKDQLARLSSEVAWELARESMAARVRQLGEFVRLAQEYAKDEEKRVLWSYSANRGPYPAGTNKCNLFVYEVLARSGAPVPEHLRFSFRVGGVAAYPPLAGEWADPLLIIPGWEIVKNPRPGDVAAQKSSHSDASGHVGIVTGPGTTVSVSSKTDTVIETGWGFPPHTQDAVVFRRYVGVP
jgi:hypothetical protein